MRHFSILKRSALISLISFLIIPTGKSHGAPKDKPKEDDKIRVLLTYGGHGFEEESFFAMLDGLDGIEYTKAELPKDANLLKPGLEKEFDVILRYDMVKAFSPEQRQQFLDLLEEGIGLVSLHHNLGAHSTWDEYRQVIGGKFIMEPCEIDCVSYAKSGFAHGQDMEISIADKRSPLTGGLEDFKTHDETYSNYYTSESVQVLLKTDHPKNDPEIAWTHSYRNSKVLYFMLGHDKEGWNHPSFQTILRNGLSWAANR